MYKKKVWSHIIYLVGGSGKTWMQIDNIPHTCDVYRLSKHIQTSDERDCYSLHSLSLPDFPTKDKSYTFINKLCIARLLLIRTPQKYGKFIDIQTHWGYCFLAIAHFPLFMGGTLAFFGCHFIGGGWRNVFVAFLLDGVNFRHTLNYVFHTLICVVIHAKSKECNRDKKPYQRFNEQKVRWSFHYHLI